ncbi:K Homology domain-containing protein [Caenorhabditis elegans]|uniref:K Homology domain-containing protein n=1 Tax=Caenorhabditis elegans TaxID=6239 RepID=Q17935_CAEEL|nr:K Homology domain-containing protein [Caenorhabditis elegans]CAA98232.1 K Homology domain-containing protein [Caenorhabditis elegans]|eukprot:NP_505632.1 FUBp (FUBP) Like [Caenorhabditis elegans]
MEGFNPQQATHTTSLKRERSEDEEYSLPAKRPADDTDLNPFMDDNEAVNEKYPIPESAVGIVIGRGGSEIQGIQAKAGCRVQMSPDADPSSGVRMVTLEGSRSNVETAKHLINEVVARSQNPRPQYGFPRAQTTIDIAIPPNRCGLIIGKSGDTIRQLQEKSGCKMILVQDNQSVSDQSKPLRITGDPQKIELAKQLVAEILNSGGDGNGGSGLQMHHAGGGGGASARGEVVVPRSSVGIIIGKQGDTIKRLAMETGTKIQFKPDDDPSTPERCAVIMGTRDQIYRATERITELVKKSTMQQGGGGNVAGAMVSNEASTFYMSVPAAKCGLVIGKGGETIKQINSESGAHCELSRDPTGNADEKVFVIKGGKRAIEHAKHLIRIKVGDIAPNTPFRDDSAMTMQTQFSAPAQNNFGGQQQWNPVAQIPAAAQNPYQVGGWQQNSVYAQQTAAPAAAPYAAAGIVQPQQQVAYQQPQVVQQVQPATTVAATTTPTVDPVTGEQDYSAQWMEYYKSIGAHDKAEAVEAQMKKKKAEAAARAVVPGGLIQQMPMGMAMPQMSAQARVPTQNYPAYSAAGAAPYQAQQYGQYQ